VAILTRVCLFILLLCIVPAANASAEQSLQLLEQEIKAGLLYNFLKYTDWPAGAVQPSSMVVCVFGDDPFDGYLKPMAGRTVNQREIAIRILHAIGDAGGCQLLFLNASEKEQWPQLRASLSGKSVLTVSDLKGFSDMGGMIEFSHKNDHVSVNLNMDAVAAAQLHVQERLLNLVSITHQAAGAEGVNQ
jgi:hypothetical protein